MEPVWNEGRFERFVASYGRNASRWPVAWRESALMYVLRNPKARQGLRQAAALDRALDAIAVLPMRAQFVTELYAVPARTMFEPQPVLAKKEVWAGLTAIAASLVLGLCVGIMQLQTEQAIEDAYTYQVMFNEHTMWM